MERQNSNPYDNIGITLPVPSKKDLEELEHLARRAGMYVEISKGGHELRLYEKPPKPQEIHPVTGYREGTPASLVMTEHYTKSVTVYHKMKAWTCDTLENLKSLLTNTDYTVEINGETRLLTPEDVKRLVETWDNEPEV